MGSSTWSLAQKTLTHIQVELPLHQLLSLASLPAAGHHQAELGPSSWHPPCRYLETLRRSPSSFHILRLNRFISLSLSWWEIYSEALTNIAGLCWTCSRISTSLLAPIKHFLPVQEHQLQTAPLPQLVLDSRSSYLQLEFPSLTKEEVCPNFFHVF